MKSIYLLCCILKVNPEEFNIIFPTLQQWKENYNE